MSIRDGILSAGDILISLFIIFPLSVLHWCGTWELQPVYFLPDRPADSAWVSFAIGSNICLLELLLAPLLIEYLSPERRLLYFVVSRLHLYVHGWAVMCYWRGLWDLTDVYLTEHWVNAVVMYVVCQLLMIVTKTVRTAVGVPVGVGLDTSDSLLEPDLVFKTPYARLCTFICDCLFTQFVIVAASICIWRSIWNILDAFIFPERHLRSDVVSLVVGFSVTVVFLLFYWPLSAASRRLDRRPVLKLVFEDSIFIVLTWANLLLWRGSWNLSVRAFLPPGYVAFGAWMCHVVGTLGLMTLQAFNTVGLHGIERDGSYSGGSGVFAITYLRELLPTRCLISWLGHELSSDSSAESPLLNGSVTASEAVPHLVVNAPSDESMSSDDELFGLLDKSAADRKVGNGNSAGSPAHGVHQYTGNMSNMLSGISMNQSTVVR